MKNIKLVMALLLLMGVAQNIHAGSDSGELENSENFITIFDKGFVLGTEYYWRINIADDKGQWSGWLLGDEPFIVSESCSE